jgi:uncharacterized membrane protein
MGLLLLVAGLVLFTGGHAVSTRRALRARLIGKVGEFGYKLFYSLVAIAGIWLMARGFAQYRADARVDLWSPPSWLHMTASVLMWPALVLVAAAYLRGRIYTTLKHPMLAGVKLWAVAHLMANGDLGSLVLFGGILAWAVFDRVSLKRRGDAGGPPIPVGGAGNDVLAVVVGTVAYAALALVFHPVVIGVAVIGG